MRLCYLADAPYIHTVRWLRYFAERGHEVHVVSFRDATIPGVKVHHVRGLERLGKLRYLALAPHVREVVRDLKPDLLHAMHLTSYGFLGALMGIRPFVLSVWGHDVFVVPKWSPAHFAITRFALARADMITATGGRMAKAAERYAPKAAAIAVIPYGVDLERFAPVPRQKRKRLVVGYLGRLSPEKGTRYLVEAAAVALRTRPDLILRLVGDGPDMEDLKRLACSLNLGLGVEFVGPVNHELVPKVLQDMDIFTLPSLAEGFGVAAIEAAAMELPVIGTRVQGIPDVVVPGATGVLVPPKDPHALAGAILDLAADGEKRQMMGRLGRQFVAERYNWRENAASMDRLYERVLASRDSKRSC